MAQRFSKRAYAGTVCTAIWCEECGARLDIRKAVWLTFDQRTGNYTDQDVPDEYSQGAFPFGRDCAKKLLQSSAIAIEYPARPERLLRPKDVAAR